MPVWKKGFGKVRIKGCELVDEKNPHIIHANTPHGLIQAAGYIKHNVARSGIYGVYFRGQREIYDTFRPTLYRGLKNKKSTVSKNTEINKLLKKIRDENKVLRDVKDYTLEPLLQHYGFKTRWIDVVDNIWIALWFSCHKAQTWGRLSEYLHFERREPLKEPEDNRYAYIFLLSCSHSKTKIYEPGKTGNRYSELIDLRYSVPSYFLRPHSQHGLLIRKKDIHYGTDIDFTELIEGIIRINLVDALVWLGDGRTFDVHSLFPPPSYDFGYQQLLELRDYGNIHVGAIHHIGA